jgi:peptidoglycan/LPS O-acetylase OafA/YrhL
VILNHANWHILSQFRSLDASTFFYIAVDQLGKVSVGLFIFGAGQFVAFMTGNGNRPMEFSAVKKVILMLFWPWAVWSLVFVAGQKASGAEVSPQYLLETMFVQYYFVPLLMFYYLVANILIRMMKHHARWLIGLAVALQGAALLVLYIRTYAPDPPEWLGNIIVSVGPGLYLQFVLYFVIGLVTGMYRSEVKRHIEPMRKWIPTLTCVAFIFACLEGAVAFTLGQATWPLGEWGKVTSLVFGLAVITWYTATSDQGLFRSKRLSYLGAHSYALYLVHYIVLGLVARLLSHTVGFEGEQLLALLLLFGATVGACVAFIRLGRGLISPSVAKFVLG